MTSVVNVRHGGGNFTLIDRRTIFGNPFRIGRDGTRDEVIEKYRQWFLTQVAVSDDFRESVLALKGRVLGCWCKPEPCHGDVIAEWLDGVHSS